MGHSELLGINEAVSIETRDPDIYFPTSERLIERVICSGRGWGTRQFVVKYGTDPRLVREMMMYSKVYCSENDPIAKFVGGKTLANGYHFMALEWIEGTQPSFKNREITDLVFTQLGSWVASLQNRLAKLEHLPNRVIAPWRPAAKQFLKAGETRDSIRGLFSNLHSLAKEMKSMVIQIGDETLYETFARLDGSFGDHLTNEILKMPLTIDPGDLSLHNTFVLPDRKQVRFIDFESAAIRPMVMVVNHIGEPYGSIPQGPNAEVALKSFIRGWNEVSEDPIDWDCFLLSHQCARVHYKCDDFAYWLEELKQNPSADHILQWAIRGSHELMDLVARAEG